MTTRRRSFIVLVCAICLGSIVWSEDPLLAQSLPAECGNTGIAGVLRVSSVNPRYFTNDCGKAIYLTGSHTWNNFLDMDDTYPPENHPFSFGQYLGFLDQYNHNFIRLWAWEGPFPNDGHRYPRRVWAGSQPWLRTGPGTDVTGHLKFDLTQWNQAYFDRLRQRVSAAQARGKYVSIMLFEGWELQFAPGANSHPFNSENNINDVGYGGVVTDIHALEVPAITAIQEEYIRRVVNSVNDLDNVLYEIANEPGGSYSTEWEYHMIQFIKDYEATKPKQHPVGMTYQYPNGTNSTLLNSAAEWIAPGSEAGAPYDTDPPANNGSKVVFSDTDHLWGSSDGDASWVWKSFMRGLNTLFMDRYDLPYSIADGPIAKAVAIRKAMGSTLMFSRRMDLLHATPDQTISSTGYALAGPTECLVYNRGSESFTVNLENYSGSLQVEWLETATQRTILGGTVPGGARETFQAPFAGDAVLYLRPAGLVDANPPNPAPIDFALHEPTPNPADPASRIAYDLPVATNVRIGVYDVSGRMVASLVDRTVPAGRWDVTWDGTGSDGRRVPGGVWFVRMRAGSHTFSRSILLIR